VLVELSIRDLALIPRLRIPFGSGLNVLSGETGAGKSLIVGSLRLLCGEKPADDAIREGAETARVEGVFELDPNGWIARELREIGVPVDDGELVLSRELASSGRGRIRANGVTLARADLERVSALLVDLHGQHDQQLLLRPSEQLDALDESAGLLEERAAFAALFRDWKESREELGTLIESTRAGEERRELRRFQHQELEVADPKPGEVAALTAERKRLEAAELLRESAHAIAEGMLESERSVHDVAAELVLRAETAAAKDPAWTRLAGEIEALRIQAQEIGRDARSRAREVVDDPGRLEEVRARLRLWSDLLRKYGPDERDVLELRERLRAESLDPDAGARSVERAREREREISARLARSGAELTRKRRARARTFEKGVARSLAHLGFDRARFEVRWSPRESGEPVGDEPGAPLAGSSGFDAAEFLFSANSGEGVRALRRVASGGEISRVMLALKSLLGTKRGTATMVFDEIDGGVGGIVAGRVGDALESLARERQVLCITHLAPIASRANVHLRVRKGEEGGRTVTTVERVDGDERVREIARMLGSEAPEGIASEHARELLRGGSA
jgi:DNA repair protein RecN (Recombination protein N)